MSEYLKATIEVGEDWEKGHWVLLKALRYYRWGLEHNKVRESDTKPEDIWEAEDLLNALESMEFQRPDMLTETYFSDVPHLKEVLQTKEEKS